MIRDRQAGGQIKVTPAMIEAGATELFSWEFSGDDECMREVYIAMEKARREGRCRCSQLPLRHPRLPG